MYDLVRRLLLSWVPCWGRNPCWWGSCRNRYFTHTTRTVATTDTQMTRLSCFFAIRIWFLIQTPVNLYLHLHSRQGGVILHSDSGEAVFCMPLDLLPRMTLYPCCIPVSWAPFLWPVFRLMNTCIHTYLMYILRNMFEWPIQAHEYMYTYIQIVYFHDHVLNDRYSGSWIHACIHT